MNMMTEEDKIIIRNEMRIALEEFFENHGLTSKEAAENCRFVKSLRESTTTMKRASWWTAGATLTAAILGLLYGLITGKIQNG